MGSLQSVLEVVEYRGPMAALGRRLPPPPPAMKLAEERLGQEGALRKHRASPHSGSPRVTGTGPSTLYLYQNERQREQRKKAITNPAAANGHHKQQEQSRV